MNTITNTPATVQKTYTTFRFVDYRVYQESKKWFQETLSLKGILETQPELWNQLKVQITALVMNITAASTKLPRDAKRYLGNAIMASNKAVACLDIACDLQAISAEEFETLSNGFKGVIIQLKRLIKAMGTPKAGNPEATAQEQSA